MSETTSCRPSTEPGAAVVTPVPKMIEHAEPGGVSCTTRKSGAGGEVGVEPPPQRLVELLGPIDVGDGQDDDLELHVHGDQPKGRIPSCARRYRTTAGARFPLDIGH